MSQPPSTATPRDDDHATTTTTATDTILVPNSQTSDAASSSNQAFQSSHRSTQLEIPQAGEERTSMSNTIDKHSRQEPERTPTDHEILRESFPRAFSPSDQKADSSTSSSSSRGSASPTHGSKRTAGGAVKAITTAADGGNQANVRNGPFTRKTNAETRGSKISELSLQLKTRLTYAMIKVQNGWEQRSIDEVESLAASQLSSPVSTTSTMLRGSLQSPRMAMASMSGRPQEQHYTRDTMSQSRYRSASSSRPGTANSNWPQPSPHLYERHPVAPRVPMLAPAVDLQPKSHHQRSDSRLSTATARSTRATTPTPQEQDAVDTLLFMSSPANSSRFTHNPAGMSHTQHSPSRSHFAIPKRTLPSSGTGPPTLYDRASASSEEEVLLSTSAKRGVGSAADMQRQAKRRSYGRLETEKDVDRLLDSMRDVVSSSEEDGGLSGRASLKPVDVRM